MSEGVARLPSLEYLEIRSDAMAAVPGGLRKALRGTRLLERGLVTGRHVWFELNRVGYDVKETYKRR